MSDDLAEFAEVARLMTEHRIDSVKMPSGLEVLKTTHVPFEVTAPPQREAVEEAVARRLEALGIVNATEETGRVPVDQDEVLFASSRAPELSLEDFRPQVELPAEVADDANDDE
jgi:hypothetical protein